MSSEPFEIDLSEIDEEKGVTSGYNSPAPGRYHMQILSVDPYGGTNGEMIIDFEVLAGSVSGQQGKVYKDYLAKTPKAAGRMLLVAIAAKLTTNAKIIAAKKTDKPIVLDWEKDLPGRQVCLDLEEDEYDGKTRVKCGFGIYAVDDPSAGSIPKHDEMLKRFLKQIGNSNQNKPPEPPATKPASADSEDPFAGLV